ncbi:MAG: 50S ribosomal protein L21 [Dehalococcoidia bacterium]
MYAIIRSGGKQYRVEEGRSITVEKLAAEEGSMVELVDVLMIAEDGEVTIGTPVIEGARVLADVEEQGKHKKIIVFKYKSKVRTRKKTGHRQRFTRLGVKEILRPGQQAKEEAKTPRRRAKTEEPPVEEPQAAVAAAEAPVAAAPAPAAAPPSVEAPAAPKPRTRRKAETAESTEAPATKPARKRAPRKTTAKDTGKAPAAKDDAKPKPARKRAPRKTTAKETE